MTQPLWLGREECLALHDMMLSQYGGLPGLRDENLLESALARPLHLYAYGNPTLCELAASYVAGIVKDHPFVDGNKRAGFMMGAGFLELNGREFFASEAEVVLKTLALAATAMTEAEYAAWLQAHSKRA
jgi:death on curing protein